MSDLLTQEQLRLKAEFSRVMLEALIGGVGVGLLEEGFLIIALTSKFAPELMVEMLEHAKNQVKIHTQLQ